MEADGNPRPTEAAEDGPELTPEQQVILRRYTHGYGDQDENGIDLSSLRRNLALTPLERYQRHQRALRNVQEMRRAAERSRLLRNRQSA